MLASIQDGQLTIPPISMPGFPPLNSPSGGYVFRIDLI
jgi:hypothetical protein